MIAIVAAALVAMPSLPPDELFRRAQAAWNARVVPPYESFELPCDQTFLASRCAPAADIEFIVRFVDGRTFARTLPSDGSPSVVVLRGGFITGPASAPLGFYRRAPGTTPPPALPPNLAPDPFAPRTITTVQAVDRAYDIHAAGEATIDGVRCTHLTLRPLRDPDAYPLRELWIDASTYDVRALTYSLPFNATRALIHYTFAPVGSQRIWAIVHIDAEARSHYVLSNASQRVSEDLENIAFPASEPAEYFNGT